VILLTPGILQRTLGLPAAVTLSANTLATVGLIAGCLLMGRCVDRFGGARSFATGCVLMLLGSYTLYVGAAAFPALIGPLNLLAGLSVGVVAGVPALIVAQFPAAVRFTGLSFSYNLAYALFGGLTPLLVSALLGLSRLAPAHYVAFCALIGIACAVVIAWRAAPPVLSELQG